MLGFSTSIFDVFKSHYQTIRDNYDDFTLALLAPFVAEKKWGQPPHALQKNLTVGSQEIPAFSTSTTLVILKPEGSRANTFLSETVELILSSITDYPELIFYYIDGYRDSDFANDLTIKKYLSNYYNAHDIVYDPTEVMTQVLRWTGVINENETLTNLPLDQKATLYYLRKIMISNGNVYIIAPTEKPDYSSILNMLKTYDKAGLVLSSTYAIGNYDLVDQVLICTGSTSRLIRRGMVLITSSKLLDESLEFYEPLASCQTKYYYLLKKDQKLDLSREELVAKNVTYTYDFQVIVKTLANGL